MGTKAQIWSLDILVAFAILIPGLIFFYYQTSNEAATYSPDVETLTLHAKSISSFLVSEGQPANWTVSNVTFIGLTDGELRLSSTKVNQYNSLNYTQTKNLLSTNRNYEVVFRDNSGNPISIGNTTFLGRNYTQENPATIVTLTRYVFYNGSIAQMVVLVW